MDLDFSLESVEITQFGVGFKDREGMRLERVSVGTEVQTALREMAQATAAQLKLPTNKLPRLDFSENYPSNAHAFLPLTDDAASLARTIHESMHWHPVPDLQEMLREIAFYFARFTDSRQRTLTGIRKAQGFKGVLKKRGLVQVFDDTLTLVDRPVFQLDHEFDFLIDSNNALLLHIRQFEYVCDLQENISKASTVNVQHLVDAMDFVDLSAVESHASRSVNVARTLASIKSRGYAQNLDARYLKNYCERNGIAVIEEDGKWIVDDSQIVEFLELLDRRQYEYEFTEGRSERYRATGRSAVKRTMRPTETEVD